MSRRTINIGALLLVTLIPAIVFAGKEGAGHEEAGLIVYWINFLVYAGILFYFLRKPITAGWIARSENIAALVKKGTAELNAANKILADAQQKVSGIDQEIKTIAAQIASDGIREAGLVVEEAKERGKRTKLQAQELATAEEKAVENSIKRELADLVISKAKEKLERQVNGDNDKGRRVAALNGLKDMVVQ